jgi:hypothetical protein
MNADQCHQRASACVANAAVAPAEAMAGEFLQLAAQWRALAVRDNFLGQLGDPAPNPPLQRFP